MQPAPSIFVRSAYLAYGVFCYALFLLSILYAIGFVGNFWGFLGLPAQSFRSLDFGGPTTPLGRALAIDALLLGLFALQHSGMARAGFKAAWTRIVPAPLERSTYVLAASSCLLLLFWQWRALGTSVLWQLAPGALSALCIALSIVGWAIVFASTFMLDHWELFGLRQTWFAFRGQAVPSAGFATPGLYKSVRHPIYLGFVIAFWSTPLMTLAHLVFALATTAYILFAIQLEERDLVRRHGDAYLNYRRSVRMLLPLPRAARRSDRSVSS
jgi:protein-S-isoprenylcysteine O-methyltransferase Ste14